MKELSIEKISSQFSPDWWEKLEPEFKKPYMTETSLAIKTSRTKGNVYPAPGIVFRAFKETPLNEVSVVWLAQDPYNTPGQATGLAMDCGSYLSPTMDQLQAAYLDECGVLSDAMKVGNLESWAKQGVLLINTALTVEERKPRSHTKIWEKFTAAVMEILCTNGKPKVFVFLGRAAQRYSPWVRTPDIQIYREHPQAANYDYRKWNHGKIYTTINAGLKVLGRNPINW